MKVIKICLTTWQNESRDKRELSACRELGAETLVMAKGASTDRFRKDTVDGFEVVRFSTRPMGIKVPNVLNRIVSIFTWSRYARQLSADVISGHDLLGLLIGWLSTWFVPKEKKPVLIYDSHEFELGREAERSKITIWFIKHLEHFLMKRCAFSIMVNDSIANEVQRIHKLEQRPVVIRSTPNCWQLDASQIAETRAELCRKMGVSKDVFLVMYHGGVMPKRNVETLMGTVARNPNIACVVLGNASPESYLEKLKAQAESLGIANRVLFHPAVPIEELYRYVGAVDVGMILHKIYTLNAEYSLPNKFFENIQSLTPLISTNALVLKEYIQQYGIGLTVDITNDAEIDSAIERMRTDKAFYAQCKKNLKTAKTDLCWEKEKLKLILEYKKLCGVQSND